MPFLWSFHCGASKKATVGRPGKRHLCTAGHTDVDSAAELLNWRSDRPQFADRENLRSATTMGRESSARPEISPWSWRRWARRHDLQAYARDPPGLRRREHDQLRTSRPSARPVSENFVEDPNRCLFWDFSARECQ